MYDLRKGLQIVVYRTCLYPIRLSLIAFLPDPATTDLKANYPLEYIEKVKNVHETGGYGSTGYRYHWQLSEAAKNLLRTHTTAVSARMLYKLAQEVIFILNFCFTMPPLICDCIFNACHISYRY